MKFREIKSLDDLHIGDYVLTDRNPDCIYKILSIKDAQVSVTCIAALKRRYGGHFNGMVVTEEGILEHVNNDFIQDVDYLAFQFVSQKTARLI